MGSINFIQRYKDDKPISEIRRQKGNYRLSNHKIILKIKKLLLSDGGKYRCVVENVYGKDEKLIEVEPLEKTNAAPVFVVPAILNQYVKIGSDINVTAEVVVFSTAHFQLIRHFNQTDPITQVIEKRLKIMATPRDIELIGPETNRKSSDAYRYRLTFKFNNLTESNFGTYSIMAGNTFGYAVTPFTIIKRQ